VGFAVLHSEHVRDTHSVRGKGREIERILLSLIIVELIGIPVPFFKATTVDNSDAIIDGIYADFIRAQSDYLSVLYMCVVNSFVLLLAVSFP